jgi:hypothetical protein
VSDTALEIVALVAAFTGVAVVLVYLFGWRR